jgi:Leucine-rich repeat (LRR) protein
MKAIVLFFILVFPLSATCQLMDSLTLDTVTAYTSMEVAMKDTANVIKLDLSKQKLTEFPKGIRKLVNLQYLDLSKNKIYKIPAWIGELKDLQVLILSKTKIDSLPTEFGELTHLKYLMMNRAELVTLPHSIGNLKELKGISLWQDNISSYPYELKNISGNLQSMDLRDVLVPQATQDYLKSLLPNTTIYFSPICPCER